jgi:WD40 repeat protein/serine/threonine protein kinase
VTDERWERVKDLLHQALPLNVDARATFLDEVCGADDSMRRELESLLAADAQANPNFLRSGMAFEALTLPGGHDYAGTLSEGQIFEQRFALLRALGEGGMGQVWLAQQLTPVRREVALKLIRAGMYDETVLQRFRSERQSLAIMDHPCIAKVFEAGTSVRGQPYFVMEYVPGLPITQYCDRERLTLSARLELFMKACEGVQHAHQRAIIHRDLKPANILVVEVDGVPTPRIIDFGLAKPLANTAPERTMHTQFGQFLGTPGYMSPEQADPDASQDIDTRTDVYSLGVILYVLLTGSRPFERRREPSQPFDEWLRQLRTVDPPRLTALLSGEGAQAAAALRATPLSALVRRLRGDLEWIASKAVSRVRERRYASAMQLAEDLRRYLRHETVTARPAGVGYQLRRFIRRHRVVATLAALIGVSGLVAAIAGILAVHRQHEAEFQQHQAQYQTQQALQAQARLLTEVAAERLGGGDVSGAQRIIVDVLTNPALPQGRSAAAISVFQEARAADRQLAVLSGHAARVLSARYSPDGRRIVTSSADKSARVWDARTGAALIIMNGHTDRVFDAAYSPDGTRIVTGSHDRTARVWDAQTGMPLLTLAGHGSRIDGVRFSPDGRQIVTASWDKTARIWDASTGKVLTTLTGHTHVLYSAAFSPDGRHVVTASQDKTARIWDARTGKSLSLLIGHGDYVTCAAYSPDGRRIVTASADRTARIWDAGSGAPLAVLSGHSDVVYSAAFSPDGQHIVTASWDKSARVWDANTGAQIAVLSGHEATLASAAYSPDGAFVVTASQDGTARIWDVRVPTQLTLSGHRDVVSAASYSRDGGRIITASNDQTARIWDAHSGALLQALSGHTGAVDSAQFSHDGSRAVTASQDKSARIWDAHTGKWLITLFGHIDLVYSGEFSPDDTRVVTASRDKDARIWDAHTGVELAVLKGHLDRVYSGIWSNDGRYVVTASRDRTVRVWDAASKSTVLTLQGHDDQVVMAAYSPDDTRIVTASSDGTSRIWDAHSGVQLLVLSGHRGGLTSVAYSPDGRQVITASEDKTARIWDAQRGEQLAVLAGHTAAVRDAAYSGDGTRVITASDDQTAKVWDAHPPADLATQVLWSSAAEIDPLSDAERSRLGIPRDPRVKAPDRTQPAASDSDVAEPDSLPELASREELAAIGENDPAVRDQRLLRALALYSTAAEQGRLQGRSDDRFRHWCYRRASLARVLAAEGLMQQVAQSYQAALARIAAGLPAASTP